MESKTDSFVIKVLSKQINTREEIDSLCQALILSKATVQSVTFTGNSYSLEACSRLAQILEDCKLLKVVNMSDMFVGRLKSEVPKSLEVLTGAVADKEVEELNVSDNAFGPIGVESIQGLLKTLKGLKRLLIANNGLGPEGAEKLCEALLASDSKFQAIEIGRNRLESKGAKALAKLIAEKKSFVKINVQQNGIKKDGTIELLKSIRTNPGIEELYLNDNWIKGGEAIALLEDIVTSCPKLKTLNLSDNNIGDEASERLFEILGKGASELERLYYNYNELSKESTIRHCLDIVVGKLSKIKALEMEGNGIVQKIIDVYQPSFEKKGAVCKLRGEDEEDEEEAEEGADDEQDSYR